MRIIYQNIKGDCPPLISQMYKHQNKLIAVTVRAFFRYSKIAFSLSELSFTVFVPKYCIAGIFRGYKMFVVFADQASTATHEVNIACMHACMLQKGWYSAKIICKNLSNGHSANVYILEIYMGTFQYQ